MVDCPGNLKLVEEVEANVNLNVARFHRPRRRRFREVVPSFCLRFWTTLARKIVPKIELFAVIDAVQKLSKSELSW